MMEARRMICDVIAEAEIGHIFGIPGGGTMRIFDVDACHLDGTSVSSAGGLRGDEQFLAGHGRHW